jgi:hypothetical protein
LRLFAATSHKGSSHKEAQEAQKKLSVVTKVVFPLYSASLALFCGQSQASRGRAAVQELKEKE